MFISIVNSVTSLPQIWHSMLFSSKESSCKKGSAEMEKAKNVILVENNLTGQMGRLLREKTGISIKEKNRILKYDGRPFWTDELRNEIKRRLK